MQPTFCDPLSLPDGEDATSGKSVNKGYLVNKLNFVNFQDETISVCLRHNRYDNAIALPAKPLPCAGERLDCSWLEMPGLQQVLTSYSFNHLLLNDGKKFLMLVPKVISIDSQGLSVILPMNGREFRVRKIKRHNVSATISAQISQNGALLHGTLADFTPVSLRLKGHGTTPQTLKWINLDSPVHLQLYHGKTILYSGQCTIIRHSCHESDGVFVLTLTDSAIQRFGHSNDWDLPQQLVPSPNMLFVHPFIGKTVTLKVAEMSGSSFTVEESEENSVLMPGMVIPELKLTFGHGLDIPCKAQVVQRSVSECPDGEQVARCTIAILDMDIHEHVKLLSILHQANDQNSYLCNSVDMEALWDFFFETGFVYPQKYAYFQANKEQIKKTYHRLYSQSPHIARHFIYQDKGAILGHISMLRFFQNSWMIHHHAARKKMSLKAGMTVLNQICHYVHVLRHFYFAHLNYVYCYYRPDNKFPNRVFGGFARQIDLQQGCSQDKFAFAHFKKRSFDKPSLPDSWEIKESCPFDLSELQSFYSYTSGGLMIDAFELQPDQTGEEKVAKEYQKLGFKKEKHLYSLYKDGVLKVIVLANSSDVGLNMANLTNCVSVIVLDESVSVEMIDLVLAKASAVYDEDEIPVLLYPFSYAEKVSYPFEKTYMLWILNLQYLDQYQEYTRRLFAGIRKTDRGEKDSTSLDEEATT